MNREKRVERRRTHRGTETTVDLEDGKLVEVLDISLWKFAVWNDLIF